MQKRSKNIIFHNNQSPEELEELEQLRIAIYINTGKNAKQAMIQSLEYEKLAIKYNHKEHYAESLSIQGRVYFELGKNDLSLKLCSLALIYTKNDELKYKTINILGASYIFIGEYSKAIEAYNIAINTNVTDRSCSILNNIATIYFKQKEYEKAIDYFNKSLENISNQTPIIPVILNNISRSYLEINNLKKAEIMLNKARTFLDKLDNPSQKMINTLNSGLLLLKKEKYTEAYEKLYDAYNNCKKLDLKNQQYSATLFLAQACFKNQFYEQAEIHYLEAMELVCNLDKRQYRDALKEYIDFKLTLGEYNKAFVLLQEYDSIGDTIALNDQKSQLNLLSIKFSHTAQNIDIKRLKKENKLHQKKVVQSKLIKKNNEALIYRNKDLVQTNNDLMISKILRSQMNQQFVHNTIHSITQLIKKNESELADKYLLEFSEFTRQIFDNNSKKEITLFSELESCYRFLALEQIRHCTKINFSVSMEETINSKKQYMPSMIIQPLLENAIKHGFINMDPSQKMNIKLKIYRKDNLICFCIKDNGIGFQQDFDAILNTYEENSLSIINKRINIFNKDSLDKKSLFLNAIIKNGTELNFSLKNN